MIEPRAIAHDTYRTNKEESVAGTKFLGLCVISILGGLVSRI